MTDTTNVYVTQCNHSFHKECFERWSSFPEISICPMCRTPLHPQLDQKLNSTLNHSTIQLETLVIDHRETPCYGCCCDYCGICIFLIFFLVLICFSQFWSYYFRERFPSKPYSIAWAVEVGCLGSIIFSETQSNAVAVICCLCLAFIAHIVKVIFLFIQISKVPGWLIFPIIPVDCLLCVFPFVLICWINAKYS
jgi:hypothetical protein